ncbi:MAG TPA: hypothetical protein VI094_22015 [Propionibacteriaceae bacterium]
MQTEDDLRTHLRRRLSAAVRNRDRIAASALRDAIAALDNAEAVEPQQDVPAQVSEHVAGGVVGLGAAEVERRILDPESQRSTVRAEIEARLAAATTYEEHGQSARADELRLGADALLAVLESRSEAD